MTDTSHSPTPRTLPARSTGRRRAALAVIPLLLAALVACSGVQQSPGTTAAPTAPAATTRPTSPFDPTTTPSAPTGPMLAYRAADEIGLVEGTTVVASVKGSFAPSNDLITTEDGRFVFARTVDNQLAVLDVAERKGSIRPVTTGPTVGTGGPSQVVWWEQPNRLMSLDLADPAAQPTVRQTADLPAVADAGATRLIVARGGTAVVARVEGPPTPFGGPDTLYAVRGPGPPSSLGSVDGNSPVTVARLSPDGASLVYGVYRATDGACGTAAVVQSGADGAQQTFDVAGSDPAAGSRVTRLWWPTTGPPNLSLSTWRCGQAPDQPPLVWQLAGPQIAQVSPPASALQTAEVAPGQRALIVPQAGDYGSAAGALVFQEGSRRISLRNDVDAIAVVPPPP